MERPRRQRGQECVWDCVGSAEQHAGHAHADRRLGGPSLQHQWVQYHGSGSASVQRHTPAQQRERFVPKYVAAFEAFGYSAAEATRLATEWLPIILPYDYTSATGYPNGRQFTDDVTDMLASLISQGKVTSDGLGLHTDYLDDFPYLGPPH